MKTVALVQVLEDRAAGDESVRMTVETDDDGKPFIAMYSVDMKLLLKIAKLLIAGDVEIRQHQVVTHGLRPEWNNDGTGGRKVHWSSNFESDTRCGTFGGGTFDERDVTCKSCRKNLQIDWDKAEKKRKRRL